MTLLEQIAQQRTNETVFTVISATIEKIATEITRELLHDAAFKDELKTIARQSIGRAFRDLHKAGRPRPKKKPKDRRA